MKDFFKPDDFDNRNFPGLSEKAAELANAKLEKHLGPMVYGPIKNYGLDTWWNGTHEDLSVRPTHRAYLFDVQEIEKECEHEVAPIYIRASLHDFEPVNPVEFKCKHCGLELEATWKVKGAK